MADAVTYPDSQIRPASNWWIWLMLILIAGAFIFIIYAGWRFFRRTTENVREEVPQAVDERADTSIRFVLTPTEVVVTEQPIVPEGEVAVEAVVKNFDDFQGKAVAVSGGVGDADSSTYFMLRQGDYKIRIMAFPEVTTRNDLNNVEDLNDQYVKVTGTVKLLTKDQSKDEFGFEIQNLDDAFWHDQMIIEAQTIEIVPQSTT